ncbi:MAG: acyl carrier protein [Bacteroidales bacterium]|nr:acyl carrier protein [Bacteroidales bacterium]
MSNLIAENKEVLRAYIKDNTFKEADLIQDNTLLFQEGFFDSMGFVLLVDFLEEKFSIQVSDEDLTEENFESVNALSRYIESKSNGQ